jgi:carboxypeptidase family protein
MSRLTTTGLVGLATALSVSMLAAQAGSQTQSTGAITGTVIDGSTRTAVPGAIVQLTPVSGNTIGKQLRQIADDAGRFAFLNLTGDGSYAITTTKLGYLDGGYGRETGPADDLRPVRVRPGEWVANLRASIWKPGAISGVVKDETGDPVVGVFVRAIVRVRIQGRDDLAVGPMTVTDDRGAYRISGLVPGRYLIHVPSVQASMPPGATHRIVPSADPDAVVDVDDTNRLVVSRFPLPPPPQNGKPMSYPMAFHPAATLVAQATTIELSYGEDRSNVDVILSPAPASRVSGMVVGPPEALQFLTLRLLPAGLEGLGQGAETATALVGADGRFTFLNVPTGAYTIDAPLRHHELIVTTPGQRLYFSLPPGRYGWNRETDNIDAFPGLQLMSTDFRGGAGGNYSGRSSVTVGGADVGNVVIQLKPYGTVRGRVVVEYGATRSGLPPTSSFIVVLDPAGGDVSLGAPRPRAILTMPAGIGEQSSARSGPGEFSVSGIAPGKYWIRARSRGGAPTSSSSGWPNSIEGMAATSGNADWLVKSIAWKGRDYANEPIDVVTADEVSDVLVTVTNSAPELSGTVRESTDLSRDRAMVIAFPAEPEQWRNYGWWPARMKAASVSGTGTYQLSSLPAGTYFVAAIDRANRATWQDAALLAQVARSAARVTLTWGGSTTVDVTPTVVR